MTCSTLLHVRVDDQWLFDKLGHQVCLDLAMSLVILIEVVHVIERVKDTAGHEVVALAAVVVIRCVGLAKLDVVLAVLQQ